MNSSKCSQMLQQSTSGELVRRFSGRRLQHASRHPQCARRTETIASAGRAAQRVQLADSDLDVSECCLGTMTWGNQNTEAEAHEQLNYAFDEAGLNFLDTAEMYPVPPKAEYQGQTDRFIGSWLKGRRREDVIIASKVSGYSEAQTYLRDSGEITRVSPAQIEESVDKSLERLGSDYIDLLQVHWPDRYIKLFGAPNYDINLVRPDDVPFEEQLRGLEAVIKAGKVRYVGVSNESAYGIGEFVHAAKQHGLPKIVSVQNSYSLMFRGAYEQDMAEACAPHHHNVSLLAYSPLAGGALTGKYRNGGDPKARLNVFPGYMERFNKSLARKAVIEYCDIAEKYSMTPTELALAWCQSRWFVASTIIGATSLTQLKENVGAFDKDLSAECIGDIERVHRRMRDPSYREE